MASTGREDAYHYFFEKVAALGYAVARNHAFTLRHTHATLLLIAGLHPKPKVVGEAGTLARASQHAAGGRRKVRRYALPRSRR